SQSQACAISADGSTGVGYSIFPGELYLTAFRWTSAGGAQDLGALGVNGQSAATAASMDGSTVVGESTTSDMTARHAFRWTAAGGMVDLGTPDPLYQTLATGVSGDGAQVIGYAYFNDKNSPNTAFIWSQASGMTQIGGTGDEVLAITTDGSYVVGGTSPLLHPRSFAFRWSLSEGQVMLPDLPTAAFAMGRAVSSDGSIVVGNCGYVAAVWTLKNGNWTVTDLDSAYAHPADWKLTSATGISANGRFVVGNANSPTGQRAFVIDRGAAP
ncbi:MAG: hypothetical protein ACHQ50_03350, partial [Fimbriimonadales bacterium]